MAPRSSPAIPPGRDDPARADGTGAIPLDPPRPLHRRLGRRALRWLRPVAAPLLHRLELRVRAAVDRSTTADAVGALSAATLKREALHEVEAQLAQFRAEVETTLAELRTELAIRLDALSLSYLRARAFSAGLAELEERLETRRRAGEDALRAELSRQGAAAGEHLGLLLQRTDTLQQRADSLQQLDWAAAETLAALVQRADRTLQRYAVPLGTETAVRTDYGYLLVPVEDERLLVYMVDSAGRLEPGTLSVMLSLLQPGDLVLDVGANVGTLCLPAAREVGPGGSVIALEPTPRTAAVLRRSLALNALEDRVEVLQCAAGEADGVGRLAISSTLAQNSLMPLSDATDHLEVAIRPLDACVPPGRAVNLVKLDVEGAELQAWRGMRRIIAENPDLAVIVEFGPSHLARAGTAIADWLGELCAPGFTAWEIEETTGLLHPLREQGLADVFSMNLLLLRDHPSGRPGLRLA